MLRVAGSLLSLFVLEDGGALMSSLSFIAFFSGVFSVLEFYRDAFLLPRSFVQRRK